MWNLPELGIEPMSPALAGGFLTTGPPGKSVQTSFNFVNFEVLMCLFSSQLQCKYFRRISNSMEIDIVTAQISGVHGYLHFQEPNLESSLWITQLGHYPLPPPLTTTNPQRHQLLSLNELPLAGNMLLSLLCTIICRQCSPIGRSLPDI